MEDPSQAPPVTAVVLNWCNEQDTAGCLRSLAEQSYPALRVLLVDNGSPDGSGDRLAAAFPDVHYLQTGSNTGYGGGNNLGIQEAREHGAELVFILNNDTVVPSETVETLVRTLRSASDVAGVSPTITYHDRPETVWYGGGRFSALRGLGVHLRAGMNGTSPGPSEPEEVSFLSGCACLLRMEALEEVGLFAADFFAYIEDVELSLRLERAGYRLLHEPRARVLHRTTPLEADPSPFQIRLRDRNRRRLMRRHFGLAERTPFLARFYVSRALHLIRYAARGDGERARAILRGMTER